MRRLLVVSPHADDAELGCGGYMARTVVEGGQVLNVVLALGDVFFGHLRRTVTSDERYAELMASMRVLGAETYVCFRDKDSRLDTVPIAEIVKQIEVAIAWFKPTEVLIPLPSSHQDHAVAYRACIAATRPSFFAGALQLVAAYEYPATSWGEGSSADSGKGGMYVEIAEYLPKKLEALSQYKTQIRDDGHCFSMAAAEAMARLRGLESGLDYAELFHVMRKVVR